MGTETRPATWLLLSVYGAFLRVQPSPRGTNYARMAQASIMGLLRLITSGMATQRIDTPLMETEVSMIRNSDWTGKPFEWNLLQDGSLPIACRIFSTLFFPR